MFLPLKTPFPFPVLNALQPCKHSGASGRQPSCRGSTGALFHSPSPRGCSPTALSAEVLQDLGQVPAVGQVSHGPGAVWDQQGVVPSSWLGGKQELIVGQVKNPINLTINPPYIWGKKRTNPHKSVRNDLKKLTELHRREKKVFARTRDTHF